MYKKDLALNNLQWLICHKTKPNQTKFTLTLPVRVLNNQTTTLPSGGYKQVGLLTS